MGKKLHNQSRTRDCGAKMDAGHSTFGVEGGF